jgi:hypothetical protein
MNDIDPVETIRKTARLLESLAAREQAKGDKANVTKMADYMSRAAQLSIALSEIETKLGITHKPSVTGIEIELVATDSQVASMKQEITTLKAELEAARNAARDGAGAFNPASAG